MVRDALIASHGWADDAIEIVTVRTTGDRVQDRALADIGGKALWTKELDGALLAGDIDFAVHSMKDVETLRPDAIRIVAMLPRADVRDRLIGAESIAGLPRGARVGTSSPRRAAQLRRLRPDLIISTLRGNVDTRLAKVANGDIDATLLAAAGLDRLGRHSVGVAVPIDVMLPAASQGAVGIEARADDTTTQALLRPIGDAGTYRCVMAERALLAHLGAGCHSPVAALATLNGEELVLRAELFSEDGAHHVAGAVRSRGDDHAAAATLAGELMARAPAAVGMLFEA